jgi:hypothetical protein
VRAAEGRPVVLSTSRHVTQGMIDLSRETWTDSTLSGQSALIGNDPYELRIAGVAEGGKLWKTTGITLSREDIAAGVTAEFNESPGLLRVTLRAPLDRTVRWSVQFRPQPAPAVQLSKLQARTAGPESPVVLSWAGNTPFFDLSRDRIAGDHATRADAGFFP